MMLSIPLVTPFYLVLTCIIFCPVLSQVLLRHSINGDSENIETMLANAGNDIRAGDYSISNQSVNVTEQNITSTSQPNSSSTSSRDINTTTPYVATTVVSRTSSASSGGEHTTMPSSSGNPTSSTSAQAISEPKTSEVSTSDGMSIFTSPLTTSQLSSNSISTVHYSLLSTPRTTTNTVETPDHRTTNNITIVPSSSHSSAQPSITSTGSIQHHSTSTTQSLLPALPIIVINEFHVNYTDWKMGDYIELKGAPKAELDSYQLVLYGGDGGTSYLTISLDGFITGSDGLFLIGDHTMKSQLTMPIPNVLLKDESLHGLALIDGRIRGQLVPNGSKATSSGLLDVLVYAKSQLAMGEEIDHLTLGFPRIILNPSLMNSEVSISRCACCSAFNSLQFRVTMPTPGWANECNLTSEQTIELSLNDMPCDAVLGHELTMLNTITNMIAVHLQGSCSCGVTSAYIQDAKFSCRKNIVYEARLRTPSDTHLQLLWRYYKSFVKETDSVTLRGVDYSIDSNCFDKCGYPDTPSDDVNVAMVAAVAGCLAVFVIIVGIVVFHIRRRRHGLRDFRSTLFGIRGEDEDHLKMEALDNDSDELYPGGDDPAFKNPWYFHRKHTTTDDA